MLFITSTTLISALALCSTLTSLVLATGPRTQCTVKYLIPDSATCDSIEQEAEVNRTVLENMNPGIKCDGTLTPGDHVCTMQYTPNCTLNDTATSQTCDELAAKWNLTVTRFVEYNDDINDSCNDLVVGDPYCVSIDGCYPGNTDEVCQQ
ncbi:hypothetical protein BC826DRAFT_438883 [Russula brevipes]|nr:hypothetical protein BC826DRAFT_438883 [Russula brevipes]